MSLRLPDFALPSLRSSLAAVFFVALVVRIIFILTLQDGFYFADGWKFTAAANHILEYGEYPVTFDRAPGYPAFLSLIYAGGSDSFIFTRIVQAVMGAFIAVLIALIGRRTGNLGVGIVAGLLWGIYPMGVFISGTIYPTSLITILLACAVLCLVTRPDEPRYTLRVALSGLLFGLCALTKPVVLGTIVLVALWLLLRRQPGRVLLAGVFLLAAVVVLLPWTIRNAYIHDRLVPIEARGLDKVVPWAQPLKAKVPSAKNDNSNETANQLNNIDPAVTQPPGCASPTKKKASTPPPQKATQSKDDIWKTTQRMAKRFPSEFISFFELYPRRVNFLKDEVRDQARKKNTRLVHRTVFGSSLIMAVSIFSVGSLYVFALIGIQAMWRDKARRRDLGLLVTLVLSFALGYAVSWGKIRYRIPVDPYIIICSAWGLVYVWRALTDKRSGRNK